MFQHSHLDVSAGKPAIAARALVRDRGRFVLGPLSFELPLGGVLGLVGPNGSGKTTLIKSLLGAVVPDSGELRVLGNAPAAAKDLVGTVLDSAYLVPDWSIPQTVQAVAPFYDSWDQDLVERLVVQLGVPVDAKVKDLSRGESSKLKLALALAPRPRLLILDEPTSGLDPLAREQVLQVIREFTSDEGRSVLFSTHISEDLESVCDQILILRDGKAAFCGALDQLISQFVLVEAPFGWLREVAVPVVGLRALGGLGVGLVRAADAPQVPQSFGVSQPSVDDVIKAFAVPEPDSRGLDRARVEGFFHWSPTQGRVQ